METEPASKISCFFKKSDDGQSPQKMILSVNFSHAFLSFVYTWGFDDAGLGLAPQRLVENVPVWRGLVQCFIREFKTTSHI
jgi:hypothetical protein